MDQWVDRYTSHAIFPSLKAVASLLAEIEPTVKGDAVSIFSVQRLRQVVALIQSHLESTDPVLVPPAPLDNMNAQLQAQPSVLQQFVTDRAGQHLISANSNADATLVQLQTVPVPLKKADVIGISDAVAALRRGARDHLWYIGEDVAKARVGVTELNAQVQAASAELASQKARLESAIAQFGEASTSAETARRALFEQEEARRAEITASAGQKSTESFTAAEEQRRSEASAALEERKAAFETLLAEATAQASELRTQLATQEQERQTSFEAAAKSSAAEGLKQHEDLAARGTAVIAELQVQKQKADELVNVIGNTGMMGGYQKVADAQKKAAGRWQWIAMVSMLGLVAFAIYAFVGSQGTDSIKWGIVAARAFVAVAFGIPATYAARQATRQEDGERRNRKAALELSAIDPYLAPPLPPETRFKVKESLASRFFGQEIPLEAKDDSKDSKTVGTRLRYRKDRGRKCDKEVREEKPRGVGRLPSSRAKRQRRRPGAASFACRSATCARTWLRTGWALSRVGARLGTPKPIVLCPWPRDRRLRVLAAIRRLEARASAEEPVLYSDEVDIHLNPKIGRDWMLRGQQRRILTPGKNQKFYLAGALDVRTGRLHTTGAASKNAALFCQLLWLLASRYRRARCVHLIVDNYGIHKARLTRETLCTFGGRIVLHFLPPYCPDSTRACEGVDAVVHAAAVVRAHGPWEAFFDGVEAGRRTCSRRWREQVSRAWSTSARWASTDSAATRSPFEETTALKAKPASRESLRPRKAPHGAARMWDAFAGAEGRAGSWFGPSATLGPGDRASLPAIFSALRFGKMKILGQGDNRVPFVVAEELATAIARAVGAGAAGRAYNLSGAAVVTQQEFLELCAGAIDVEPPRRRVPVGVAKLAATGAEWVHRAFGRKGAPSMSRLGIAVATTDAVVDCSAAAAGPRMDGSLAIRRCHSRGRGVPGELTQMDRAGRRRRAFKRDEVLRASYRTIDAAEVCRDGAA